MLLTDLLRCNWCSRQLPRFRVSPMASGQGICDDCLDWHKHAMAFIGGECLPRGCQGCGLTWEVLRDSTVGVEVRMYGVPKDGIYQLLCAACVRPYVARRADLYKGTQFAHNLKL
jgi:hypothetical protein